MIRLLQLARAIRQIGYRPVLIYQDFTRGDLVAMRKFWGPDLYPFRYRARSLSWAFRRVARRLLSPGQGAYHCAARLQNRLQKWLHNREHAEFCIQLDDLYDRSLSPAIRQIAEMSNPCACICLDVFMTKCFEMLPDGVLRILDTNDLYAVGRETAAPDHQSLWVHMSLEDELRGYARADLVWAIQGRDEEKIRAAASELQVATVGHMVDLLPPDFEKSLRSKEALLVATSHKWNLQGLRWFAAEVYPLVQDILPAGNVVVVGDIADVLEQELPFRFLGRVPDLSSAYRSCRLVISPILGGSGLKIKNIEPMGYGKAVVTTRSAATGLEEVEGMAFLVGENPSGFASCVRRVMLDDSLCRTLMDQAFTFAHRWNQGVLSALQQSFEMQHPEKLKRADRSVAGLNLELAGT